MNFIKAKYLIIISSVYLFFSNIALAEDPPVATSTSFINPIKFGSIGELLEGAISTIQRVSIPIITLAIVYVGFQFVTAQGSPDKIKDAKRHLGNVLIGAAIIIGISVILAVITGTVDSIRGQTGTS